MVGPPDCRGTQRHGADMQIREDNSTGALYTRWSVAVAGNAEQLVVRVWFEVREFVFVATSSAGHICMRIRCVCVVLLDLTDWPTWMGAGMLVRVCSIELALILFDYIPLLEHGCHDINCHEPGVTVVLLCVFISSLPRQPTCGSRHRVGRAS